MQAATVDAKEGEKTKDKTTTERRIIIIVDVITIVDVNCKQYSVLYAGRKSIVVPVA